MATRSVRPSKKKQRGRNSGNSQQRLQAAPKHFLSDKVSHFTESVIREMTRQAMMHGAVNLAQGFPDFSAPEEIKKAAQQAVGSDINQYAITWGAKNLRNAIARQMGVWQGITVEPEKEITVCCGSTEAMISTLLAVCNAGDEVVIFEPFYENYGPDSVLSGAKPKFVKLRPPKDEAGEWSFDERELRRAFDNQFRNLGRFERRVDRPNDIEQRVAAFDTAPQGTLEHPQARREVEPRRVQGDFSGPTKLRATLADCADGLIQGAPGRREARGSGHRSWSPARAGLKVEYGSHYTIAAGRYCRILSELGAVHQVRIVTRGGESGSFGACRLRAAPEGPRLSRLHAGNSR